MWHLIGIDEDGTRHHCRQCASEEEIRQHLAEAPSKLQKMCEPYLEAMFSAELEWKDIQKLPKQFRPLTCEYQDFKDQGFFIDHFIIEYKEGDY
jgi:hypothetical protein